MAIFSRRDVQAALNSLAGSLTRAQLKERVHRLNGDTSASLATEWEVVVLSAFSRCGRIHYEKNFGGKGRPDLLFQLGKSGKFEFVADITTISDASKYTENPYEEFREAIHCFLQKCGHSGAGLDVNVEHEEVGAYGDRKVRLLLPERGDMIRFVKSELGQFLSGLAHEPDKDAHLTYDHNGVCFTLEYDSREKRFSGGSHISYTVPYSVRRNPLANALVEKGKRLAHSGYEGPKGIIVCDGGCGALQERSSVGGAYGCREVVEGFLRTRSSILFVFVLRTEEHHRWARLNSSVEVRPQLYWNPRRDKRLLRETAMVFDRMLQCLPCPEASPSNAIRWLSGRNKDAGRPVGGFSMNDDTIKISARALTELLAGEIEPKRFLEEHRLKPIEQGPLALPFFKWQLQKGHTLKNAFVERDEHRDDDWIVLEYGGPDPAITPYRVP